MRIAFHKPVSFACLAVVFSLGTIDAAIASSKAQVQALLKELNKTMPWDNGGIIAERLTLDGKTIVFRMNTGGNWSRKKYRYISSSQRDNERRKFCGFPPMRAALKAGYTLGIRFFNADGTELGTNYIKEMQCP